MRSSLERRVKGKWSNIIMKNLAQLKLMEHGRHGHKYTNQLHATVNDF